MKHKSLLLGMALALVMAMPALAQDATPQGPPPEGMGRHGRMGGPENVDERVKRMTEQLNLTSDQQAKVKNILEDQRSKMMALRNDTSSSPDDRRAKMMDIHRSSMDQINAVLTPEQQQKMSQMQEHRRGRGNGNPVPGAAPPSPPDSSNPPPQQ